MKSRIMSNDENARNIEDEDGDLPSGGRLRGCRFRSREDVNKSRKDLLMHILHRTGDFHTSEDEDKEGSRTINPYDFAWKWDENKKSDDVVICSDGREAYFHPDYSCGTSAVRGTNPLIGGWEHYWEIKMASAVYGTDMMIGVGTEDVDLNRYKSQFCSMLGRDSESWGLSYFGTFQNEGKMKEYTEKFDRGTVIGVHLDMWQGTLSYFKNGSLLGVAAKDLKGKNLYPIIASTAARTRMKLECSLSTVFSLQYLCVKEISKHIPHTSEAVACLPLPRGLKLYVNQHLRWLSHVNNAQVTPGPKRKKLRTLSNSEK